MPQNANYYTRGRNPKHLKFDQRRGRSQHATTLKGQQHTDFNKTYNVREKPVDLFAQTFRISARMGGRSTDISAFVEQLSWEDQSADVLSYVNSQAPMTGSVQLRKPALDEYKKLLPTMFNARLDKSAHGVSRFGALGVVIVCEVGYGKAFTPLWAMRVQPTASGSGSGAEEVQLADGTWTLQLADDLQLLGQSNDDFVFTKGKKIRKQGWRAHEITAEVCKQYGVPVKQLARGTAWFEFSTKDTSNISPLTLIANAYTEEMNRTGKAFIVRWSAPTKKHPLGALEVVPLRRNPNLLQFRDQLTNAVLSRSQQPDYATVILGRATLKGDKGKHEQITYLAHNETAIRRFGWVHKIIDFKSVSSHLELQILTKRALAFRLTPLRSAELTHPGIATIRRGDAIKISIPEEGYADVALTAFGTPKMPRGTGRSKYTALALQQAELLDPSLFGLPDPTLLSPVAPTNLGRPVGATTKKVYLIGDSILQSSSQHDARALRGNGWSSTIDGKSGRQLPAGLTIISGHPAALMSADAVVVELGTNASGSTSAFATQVNNTVAAIHSANPGATIYWVNLFSNGAHKAAYNGVLRAQSGITVIDASSAHISVGSDGVHPTTSGETTFANTIARALGKSTGSSTTTSTAASSAAGGSALTSDTPVVVPVADQSIAFVTSITHTVAAGSYSMDMQTSFVDILDPVNLKAEIEANIRNAKAAQRAATGSTTGTPAATGANEWAVIASQESLGGTGSCGHGIVADGYSELSTVPMGTSSDFAALGRLPCGTRLVITNPANGRAVTTTKQDIGAGSSFLPVMGLYPGTVAKLGLSGGEYHIHIRREDGQPLKPVRGTPV